MATTSTVETLKKTPLNAIHRAAGARMVDFGGWDMPVEYSGIIAEHMAVRTGVGLFDVSHMGEIEVRGPQALELVNYVTSNNVAVLVDGQAQYFGSALSQRRIRGRYSRSSHRIRALFPLRERLESGQGF